MEREVNVKVFVFDKSEKQIREYKTNLRRPKSRAWLLGMMIWAMTNGCSIEIESYNETLRQEQ